MEEEKEDGAKEEKKEVIKREKEDGGKAEKTTLSTAVLDAIAQAVKKYGDEVKPKDHWKFLRNH